MALLQGSAYVQSDMPGIFNAVASAVKSGVMTMFVGTPCQCAAVVSYLRAKRAICNLEGCGNLLVCDLICMERRTTSFFALIRNGWDHVGNVGVRPG